MKAKINGIDVEGTIEEVAALIQRFGQQQMTSPYPTYPSYDPYIYQPKVTCSNNMDDRSMHPDEAQQIFSKQMTAHRARMLRGDLD